MNAADFLAQNGISSTDLRVQIIEVLQCSNRPVSYDEILSLITANKTTIYRNLDLFLSKGLITKTEINRKNVYELANQSKAYFVCESCHSMVQIDIPSLLLPGKSIKVVKGVCEKCN